VVYDGKGKRGLVVTAADLLAERKKSWAENVISGGTDFSGGEELGGTLALNFFSFLRLEDWDLSQSRNSEEKVSIRRQTKQGEERRRLLDSCSGRLPVMVLKKRHVNRETQISEDKELTGGGLRGGSGGYFGKNQARPPSIGNNSSAPGSKSKTLAWLYGRKVRKPRAPRIGN